LQIPIARLLPDIEDIILCYVDEEDKVRVKEFFKPGVRFSPTEALALFINNRGLTTVMQVRNQQICDNLRLLQTEDTQQEELV